METKEISAQTYNAMPRKVRRELNRSLEKQGLPKPNIVERVQLVSLVQKEPFLEAVKILEKMGMNVDAFLDIAIAQLLKANK